MRNQVLGSDPGADRLGVRQGLVQSRGGEPLKDLVAALVGMKDLTGGGKGGDVDALLKGIELAHELNASRKRKDPRGRM